MKITHIKICYLVIAFLPSCNNENKNNQETSTKNKIEEVQKYKPLDRNLINEEFLKKNMKSGMTKEDVEKIIGSPYSIRKFMDTERAVYHLTPPHSNKGLNLVGFTIAYKEEKLHSVDEDWLGVK